MFQVDLYTVSQKVQVTHNYKLNKDLNSVLLILSTHDYVYKKSLDTKKFTRIKNNV